MADGKGINPQDNNGTRIEQIRREKTDLKKNPS